MKDVDGTELKKAIKSGKPIAVFFYMTTCGHCVRMQEPWKELEKEVPSVDFYRIESGDVPSEMNVSSFPHFEVHGNKKVKADGEMTKEELKKLLFGGRTGGKRTRRFRSRGLTRRRRGKSRH